MAQSTRPLILAQTTQSLVLPLQPDGKILVCGGFSTLDGQPRNYLARLNPDGSVDDSYNPGTDLEVSCLSMQADGKLLVGGWFTHVAGLTRTHTSQGSMPTVAWTPPSIRGLIMSLLLW